MRYIKTYKIFENFNSELESKLKEFKIENYAINSDGTINVDSSIYLNDLKLKKIPFKFGKITYEFNCAHNKLESLEGCPTEIGDNFYCSFNNLTSLEYCPLEIGGDFYCLNNKLTMLDCSSYIKGDIKCWGNKFTEEPEFFGDCEGKIIWE